MWLTVLKVHARRLIKHILRIFGLDLLNYDISSYANILFKSLTSPPPNIKNIITSVRTEFYDFGTKWLALIT